MRTEATNKLSNGVCSLLFCLKKNHVIVVAVMKELGDKHKWFKLREKKLTMIQLF